MSLVSIDQKDSRSLARNIGTNFNAWKNDLRLRLESQALKEYVFDKVTAKFVSIANASIQDARMALFESIMATSDSSKDAKTRSQTAALDQKVLLSEEKKSSLKQLQSIAEGDRKAWAQVAIGLEGAIVTQIQDKTAYEAYREVERTYGMISHMDQVNLLHKLADLSLNKLDEKSVIDFLERHKRIVSECYEAFGTEEYTLDRQLVKLTSIMPMEFIHLASNHIGGGRHRYDYLGYVANVRALVANPIWAKKYGKNSSSASEVAL